MTESESSKIRSGTGVLLLGAGQGGVVNNPKIGLRLAQLLFGPLFGSTEPAGDISLRIIDAGDRWSIKGNLAGLAPSRSGMREFQIDKSDGSVVAEQDKPAHDLLRDPTIALKLAAAILENAAGTEELRRQVPLSVEDQGETWRIRGSANANRAIEGPGSFDLEIQKRDARILDMKFEWVLETPPDIRAMLRASAATSKGVSRRKRDRDSG